MPRVYHRKSVTGCDRCKQRRVKCDEVKPQCSACQRHQVPCRYQRPAPTTILSELATATVSNSVQASSGHFDAGTISRKQIPDQETLELALIHYFLTETIKQAHDPIELWKTRLPLTGLKRRYVLDALLSLAALDLYRHTYADYVPPEDGVQNSERDPSSIAYSIPIGKGYQHYLLDRTPWEMRHVSHIYFESAIDGHRKSLEHLNKEDFEPAFLAAIAIYMMSLYSLACPEEDDFDEDTIAYDFQLWFSLGSGCREIVRRWDELVGESALRLAGYHDFEPDFSKEEELFHEKHRNVFPTLLLFGRDFEMINAEEDRAYNSAVSLLGLIYKCFRDEKESVRTVGSYIASFAAKVPPPFQRLVLERRPRALAIVGHLFAMVRLVEAQLPHLKGISGRQIPIIIAALPPAWNRAMEWVVDIAAQDPESVDADSPPRIVEDATPTG